jgi:hypothetical protein
MIKFTTVQELIDGGYTLHANCHNWHCQNNQSLDLSCMTECSGPSLSRSFTPYIKSKGR